jgi:hypothetical protein
MFLHASAYSLRALYVLQAISENSNPDFDKVIVALQCGGYATELNRGQEGGREELLDWREKNSVYILSDHHTHPPTTQTWCREMK